MKTRKSKQEESAVPAQKPTAKMNHLNVNVCWVARAVYGEDNPRWMLFRDWLVADAPAWFRDLYFHYGERFARWIAPHPAIKTIIRRWMDSVIDQQHSGSRLTTLSAHWCRKTESHH